MMMNIDTNPRGMIRLTLTSRLTGKSRRTFLKCINVCTNLPMGTSRKNALVMAIPSHTDLFNNLAKHGYAPEWVPCESKWTIGPDYDVDARQTRGYTVYRDGMYPDINMYADKTYRHMSYEAAVALMNEAKTAVA